MMGGLARRWLLATLAPTLYALPFVDVRLAPVAFVAWAPGLVLLCSRRDPLGAWSVLGWTTYMVAVAGYIVGLPLAKVSHLATAGFVLAVWAPAFVPPVLAFAWLRHRTGWPMALLWPCTWVLGEWLLSYVTLGEVALGLSGYTQFAWPRFIQVADLAGVLGVGFLMQAVAGGMADLLLSLARTDGDASETQRAALRPRPWLPLAGAVAGVLFALAYGTVRLRQDMGVPGPRLALVQPVEPHSPDPARGRFVQLRQVGLASASITPDEADLLVFPENAVLQHIEGSEYQEEFQWLSEKMRAPILVGASTRVADDRLRIERGEPPMVIRVGHQVLGRVHNSAVLITPEGIVGAYNKMHLLVFSEALPLEWLAESVGLLDRYRLLVQSVLGFVGTAVPGDAVTLMSIPGDEDAPFWAPLCFEVADARLARESARKGARYLVNLTSEGHLGPQIYWHTTAIAVLRAVELRVGVARAGNTGITAIIDPHGRITDIFVGPGGSPWMEPGVLKARVELGTGRPTFHALAGDWPVVLAAVVLLAGCVRARGANPPRRGDGARHDAA